MTYLIILTIAIISILLAFRSLKKLTKMEEIHSVKRELKKRKVIYQKDVSSRSSE